MMENRVLVTGATGFIGHALVDRLAGEGSPVRAASRRMVEDFPANVETAVVGDLTPDFDWRATLAGVDSIVHCAARVHVMKELAPDSLAEFRLINTAGTLNLARQAAGAGVRRLVFISSIGVNGTETFGNSDKCVNEPPHLRFEPSMPMIIKQLRGQVFAPEANHILAV